MTAVRISTHIHKHIMFVGFVGKVSYFTKFEMQLNQGPIYYFYAYNITMTQIVFTYKRHATIMYSQVSDRMSTISIL